MTENRFKGNHFPKCIVLQTIYWYLWYALSYRDIEELQIKYLNNVVEQDHRSIERIVKPMLGFKEFHSACVPLNGIELVRMIRKGRLKNQRDLRQTPAEIFNSPAA